MTSRSDEGDTISWAVSLYFGARYLAAADPPDTNDGRFRLPMWLLVGFALENGIKAVLEFKKVDPKIGRWKHSHKLGELIDLADDVGFDLDPSTVAFIKKFSRYHEEFHFRYPEKAGLVELPSPEVVVARVEDTLQRAFLFIGRARF